MSLRPKNCNEILNEVIVIVWIYRLYITSFFQRRFVKTNQHCLFSAFGNMSGILSDWIRLSKPDESYVRGPKKAEHHQDGEAVGVDSWI